MGQTGHGHGPERSVRQWSSLAEVSVLRGLGLSSARSHRVCDRPSISESSSVPDLQYRICYHIKDFIFMIIQLYHTFN